MEAVSNKAAVRKDGAGFAGRLAERRLALLKEVAKALGWVAAGALAMPLAMGGFLSIFG